MISVKTPRNSEKGSRRAWRSRTHLGFRPAVPPPRSVGTASFDGFEGLLGVISIVETVAVFPPSFSSLVSFVASIELVKRRSSKRGSQNSAKIQGTAAPAADETWIQKSLSLP